MAEDVKINVRVDVGSAAAGMNKLSDATRAVNQQVKRLAANLTKIVNRAVDSTDAVLANDRFISMRRVSSGLRGYSGLAEFLEGPGAALRDQTARAVSSAPFSTPRRGSMAPAGARVSPRLFPIAGAEIASGARRP